ncbi:MAG: hypothetical protein JXA22_07915 [Candidatus Thermoplasmatota archaeon]|nr:hypothetical protein [Candidatus Thermoplasmatota archaeon]
MTVTFMSDTNYEKLIIYPCDVDPEKMHELMRTISRLRVPICYEQY